MARLAALLVLFILTPVHGELAAGQQTRPMLDGTWKLAVLTPTQEVSTWLVKLESKENELQLTSLSSKVPEFENGRMVGFKRMGRGLVFHIDNQDALLKFVFYLPGGQKPPDRLLGSMETGSQRQFARLERTDLKELTSSTAYVPILERQELLGILRRAGQDEKVKGMQEFADKYAGSPLAIQALMELVRVLAAQGAGKTELNPIVARGLEWTGVYGPEIRYVATVLLVQNLLVRAEVAAYAAELAQTIDRPPPGTALAPYEVENGLQVAAIAYRKAGKAPEAHLVSAELEKLRRKLDQEFLQTSIPFKPEPVPARPAGSSRVVLLELFVGIQDHASVAAQSAFDAILRHSQRSQVVCLQYHNHSPGLDPLTNEATARRSSYYRIPGLPSAYVAGKSAGEIGGSRRKAQARYQMLAEKIAKAFESDASIRLQSSISRDKDRLKVTTLVGGHKSNPGRTYLRHVLVEEAVSLVGANRQRVHHNVVRAFPGGVAGKLLEGEETTTEVLLDLGELRGNLERDWKQLARRLPFLDDARPFDLRRILLVAFVQDDQSQEVLQAVQMAVPEGR